MKKVRFEFLTALKFEKPVSEHYFSLRCMPCSASCRKIDRLDFRIFPDTGTWKNKDSFGNIIISGRYSYPHISFIFGISGKAFLNSTERDKTGFMQCYRFPSVLTNPGKEISEFYNSVKDTAGNHRYERAVNFSRMVYDIMKYSPDSTDTKTTAEQAFIQQRGVCQDYAHILLAILRLDGIPCRYAAGFFTGEGQTHGWVEIYDNGWIGIDPTNNRIADDDYLKITHGRDFTDCSIDRGVIFGDCGIQFQNVTAFMTAE